MENERYQWKISHFGASILLCSAGKCEILSTSHLLQTYPDEHITLHQDHLLLSGNSNDSKRAAINVSINPSDNLPTSLVFDQEINPKALMSIINEVSNHNINLQFPEKELLRWHCKLGHMGFNKKISHEIRRINQKRSIAQCSHENFKNQWLS